MSEKRLSVSSPVAAATCLFALAALAVVAALLPVVGAQIKSGTALAPLAFLPSGVYLAGFLISLGWLKLIGWRGDAGLFGSAALLCGIGLVMQMRMGGASSDWQQLLPLPAGILALMSGAAATAGGRGAWMSKIGWLAYIGAVGLMAAMLALGNRLRGGVFMPGNMNPSELVKPLLVLFLASYLSRRDREFSAATVGIPTPPLRDLLLLAGLWCVPTALAILLHDLGLMMLLNATLLIMLFAVARRTGYLALGLLAATAAGYAVQSLSTHARARFDVWLDPFADPTGKGWQTLQALSAMYSGGLWGAGLGSGEPHSIPIVTSDFIYAALAEEIGLVGCVLLVLAYLVFFSRSFRAAGAAATVYGRLLGAGLAGSLAVQTLFNIAGVVKALPMTGITLPFISHGGSSMVTVMLMAGMLVGLSDPGRAAAEEKEEDE